MIDLGNAKGDRVKVYVLADRNPEETDVSSRFRLGAG
jgi:hypothetical protein